MNSQSSQLELHCPECDAQIPGPGECWLCHAKVMQPREVFVATEAAAVDSPFAKQAEPKNTLLIGTLATFGMILLIGFGTWAFDVWVSIVYWVLVAPAAVAIAALVLSFQAKPRSGASTGLKIVSAVSTIFLSLAIGIIVGIVLIVAAIIASIQACFAAFGIH